MSNDISVFLSGCAVAVLIPVTMFVLRQLIRTGRQIRRSLFVTIVTMIAAIGGLIMGVALHAGPALVIVVPLYFGAVGLMSALGVSLVLYRRK